MTTTYPNRQQDLAEWCRGNAEAPDPEPDYDHEAALGAWGFGLDPFTGADALADALTHAWNLPDPVTDRDDDEYDAPATMPHFAVPPVSKSDAINFPQQLPGIIDDLTRLMGAYGFEQDPAKLQRAMADLERIDDAFEATWVYIEDALYRLNRGAA